MYFRTYTLRTYTLRTYTLRTYTLRTYTLRTYTPKNDLIMFFNLVNCVCDSIRKRLM